MTREQAIEHGKEQLEIFGGEHKEFIELAIKALEQEPCKDCISREAVLNLFNKSDDYRWETTLIRKKIEKMPSVTPQEPRKGHWIECMPGGAEEWCYKCSECNFWKYKKTINLSKFKFCPNCGAKMEVKE